MLYKAIIANWEEDVKKVKINFGQNIPMSYDGPGAVLTEGSNYESCLTPFIGVDLTPSLKSSEISLKGNFVFEVYANGDVYDDVIPIIVSAKDIGSFLNNNYAYGLEAEYVGESPDGTFTYIFHPIYQDTWVYIYAVSADYLLSIDDPDWSSYFYSDNKKANICFYLSTSLSTLT